ncbi:TadE/TadG family type IV pilus assembly protein [Rhizobium rhizogenes]|jgi:Flp pilus assembly protein TadG|uniref:TadE/TadG family type IV pilus assembly protein n=1 Tax=Rhizobium rhizogenes TaxID=359 RepID=UPI0022C6EC7C|nr:TadE/TadG family type IV pilus assembly protein [Rhizobium rhizogenes]MCZ7464037.1 TadE/TadG family type IV pilus assembly protein [Rhizobium rhizogenes]
MNAVGLISRFHFIARCRSGAAAVEMALLAPLLMLILAVVIEVGRGWLSYDRFVMIVDNTARWSARFPEFETRVRTGVDKFVTIAGNDLIEMENLNLTLRSAKVVGSTTVLQFPPYNFFGTAEGVEWEKTTMKGNFGPKDSIIVVSGRYSYKPLFSMLSDVTISFEHVTAINPFFSRHYPYQAGKSDFGKWNVM